MKRNERGFNQDEPIQTDYGHEIRVYESSAAKGPCLWLAVEKGEARFPGDLGPEHAHAHMTIEQAQELRDSLGRIIDNHYQLGGSA